MKRLAAINHALTSGVVLRSGQPLGIAVADVVCRLVVDGKTLGELRDVTYRGPDGRPREGRVVPAEWFIRLNRAIEVGAFERLTVKEIVARILQPPPAAGSGDASAVASASPETT